jgi:hypothetical protein
VSPKRGLHVIQILPQDHTDRAVRTGLDLLFTSLHSRGVSSSECRSTVLHCPVNDTAIRSWWNSFLTVIAFPRSKSG